MPKFVAGAVAVVSLSLAGALLFPGTALAATVPDTTLRVCAEGAPMFIRALAAFTNQAFVVGVGNHHCQDIVTTRTGVDHFRVSRVGTASSSLPCGPATEMQCQYPQFPTTEILVDDFYGVARVRGDNAEVSTIARDVATATFFARTEL